VSESDAPGLPKLHTVHEEIEVARKLMIAASARISAEVDHSQSSSVQAVINTLPTAHFIHLACHGQQKESPLESHFALRDGNLTISELMKLNLAQATLAFLSACETARADTNQPDQAVHLAASMLFCGFRSIIGTMWLVQFP
jgi:CHAT domain-containing protein